CNVDVLFSSGVAWVVEFFLRYFSFTSSAVNTMVTGLASELSSEEIGSSVMAARHWGCSSGESGSGGVVVVSDFSSLSIGSMVFFAFLTRSTFFFSDMFSAESLRELIGPVAFSVAAMPGRLSLGEVWSG